ncbi:MAG TPA: 3-isopropylmalate dehydratase small subunit [Frankiaceae bacterium]|jgi:3-isopropylmalate/(R)-2-methylmalate dehydratase small subunit|nr:3-isopropylmalate dehydratase small subunit [Frankiaceae bacterium]
MDAFTVVRGPVAPLLIPDINTDVISPAHGGQGSMRANAFAPLRYLSDGTDNPEFPLNQEAFRDAPILLGGHNFGCGSSRESAVWSLIALGIRCVIAESFADIFYGNCFQNGVLPIVLGPDELAALARESAASDAIEVDLRTCAITTPLGRTIGFEVNPTRRAQLLEGLDDLDVGVRRRTQIEAFQRADRVRRPWVYLESAAVESPPTSST